MFRLACIVFLVFTLGIPLQGFSHDLWVNASQDTANGLVKGELGYGHNFPDPEAIAADRLHIFKPMRLVTSEGTVEMTQKGENYAYEIAKELGKGSYLVLGDYKPTCWSKNADGWKQANRSQMPDATYCEEAVMTGKAILNVGGAVDTELIKKPTGQPIEIIPLANPATIQPGKAFPLQVLYKGKPVKTAEVTGTFAGFSSKEYKAFYGRTDLEGKIDFIPLKEGYWFIQVEHKDTYPDKQQCDEVIAIATLSFHIDKQ